MSVLDVFPSAEKIEERAEKIDIAAGFKRFGRAVAAAVVAVLVFVFGGIGWLVGASIYAITWVAAAVAEGYSSGRRPGRHRRE